MLNALRSIRVQQPIPTVFSSPLPFNNFSRRTCGIKFQQAAGTNLPEGTGGKMEKSSADACVQGNKPRGETIESFGEGYVTRCDEEGFGGIYGGNQELPKEDEEKIVYANVPEFDTSQGSEVKEKEKPETRSMPQHKCWNFYFVPALVSTGLV